MVGITTLSDASRPSSVGSQASNSFVPITGSTLPSANGTEAHRRSRYSLMASRSAGVPHVVG